MPERREHRGPHPEDLRLFAADTWPVLRAAAADLAWLLGRGYAQASTIKLVGDRYNLVSRQRLAVARATCSEADAARRKLRQVAPAALAGRALWLDGYNVLTTIEAALGGGIVLAARDGAFRDMASMHGSYRKVCETLPALELLGATLTALGIAEAVWLLDRPVSNSGRLKTIIEELAAARGWRWRVEMVADPDANLINAEHVVASADSVILDHCLAWFNLARETVVRYVADARIVDLSGGEEELHAGKTGH